MTQMIAPQLTTLAVPIGSVRPHPSNPNAGDVGAISVSLEQFAQYAPIVVQRSTGHIVKGNHTYLAARALGWTEIAANVMDLDDTQALAVLVGDNRHSELGTRDQDALAVLLTELAEADALLGTGYDGDDVDALLAELAGLTVGQTDPDAVPEPSAVPITQPGDLWVLGRHRLLCGDSTVATAVERLIDGERVAMVYTDPPYGISIVGSNGHVGADKLAKVRTYVPVIGDETNQTAVDAYTLCAALGIPTLIFWGGNHYASALPDSSCWLVWDKRDGMAGNNFADCELAWTNLKRAARLFAHRWSGMLMASERGERVHPTQKPVALAAWAFEEFGQTGDIVLDIFGGSGSTLIAAEQTGRTAYLAEISPAYCDVIVRRWAEFTGLDPVREDGTKWSEVAP